MRQLGPGADRKLGLGRCRRVDLNGEPWTGRRGGGLGRRGGGLGQRRVDLGQRAMDLGQRRVDLGQ